MVQGPKTPRASVPPRLLRRCVVASVGLAIFFVPAYFGGWSFFALTGALAVVALGEYYSALQAKGMRPNVGLGFLCSLLILYVTQHTIDVYHIAGEYGVGRLAGANLEAEADALHLTVLILMFCVAGTLIAQFRRPPGQSAVTNTATTVFGVIYLGLLFTFLLRLRYIDVPMLTGVESPGAVAERLGAILMVLGPVWVGDAMAYFVGSTVGRTKLAPLVSPNKTVEGAVAGLVSCVLGSLALGLWLHLPAWHAALLGLLIGVVGQLGDLGKSTLKRDLGIKDFGSVFGPHGGVLDRFDAMLFTIPLAYWYFWFILMHVPSG